MNRAAVDHPCGGAVQASPIHRSHQVFDDSSNVLFVSKARGIETYITPELSASSFQESAVDEFLFRHLGASVAMGTVSVDRQRGRRTEQPNW